MKKHRENPDSDECRKMQADNEQYVGGLQLRERLLQEHLKNSDSQGHHVDGCYYCGGNHPSDCCFNREDSCDLD